MHQENAQEVIDTLLENTKSGLLVWSRFGENGWFEATFAGITYLMWLERKAYDDSHEYLAIGLELKESKTIVAYEEEDYLCTGAFDGLGEDLEKLYKSACEKEHHTIVSPETGKKLRKIDVIIDIMKKLEDMPVHYIDLAKMVEKRLPSSGKTPENTINAYLTNVYKDKFAPLGNGFFVLAQYAPVTPPKKTTHKTPASITSADNLISAFGRHWERSIFEQNKYKILGYNIKDPRSAGVDVTKHAGIYLLENEDKEIVYVGQAGKSIAKRLKDHTSDKHADKWTRFSWFSIKEFGKDVREAKTIQNDVILNSLEALLIEVLSPANNDKCGNNWKPNEYGQQATYLS